MKIYQVEVKTFFKDNQGLDRQQADLGETPAVAFSVNKAIFYALKYRQLCEKYQDYEYIATSTGQDLEIDGIIERYELQAKKSSKRKYITIYEKETLDKGRK